MAHARLVRRALMGATECPSTASRSVGGKPASRPGTSIGSSLAPSPAWRGEQVGRLVGRRPAPMVALVAKLAISQRLPYMS
jgi:hypothetical protein